LPPLKKTESVIGINRVQDVVTSEQVMKEPDNEQFQRWAVRIRKSDQKAFDCLFRALYARLVHYACRFTRHKPAACDIVQDAFVALWQNRDTIDPELSIKAYLYRIVKNSSINWTKKHVNRSEPLTETHEVNYSAPQAHEPDHGETINHMNEQLRLWIDDLPERQQEAFELSRFEGLDHGEIASVMNVSPKTVNNHIVAALGALRERYDIYMQNPQNAERP
jgi:RNA polymerase sigma-70 factor, ECF subfamily